MVDLKANPYFLCDEDIQWVNDTIAAMTPEEKVGQLFFQLTAGMDENYLRELMEKYHLGGIRYNNMPGQYVQMQNRMLQKYAKIPVIIACNTENGGAAKERGENGHPEPFGVELWGIGNENWGDGGHMTPEMYMREFIRYRAIFRSINKP